ncbi:MAG: fumarylacetoacetate hydrolase family protein [Myxococcota bacterium]|nr:fumarylacetoacetate hydrolase family protein [Myxococcota bacterium]
MRLVTFSHADATRIGVLAGDEVVDLAAARSDLPTEMCAFLAAGPDALAAARAADGPRLALSEVCLQAPVLRPPKILAVGLNYADHVAESGMETPKTPKIFNKQSTSVVGPGAGVHLPRASQLLDYEGELAVVIGKRCRHVPKQCAPDVIAGYTIANDVSVRDWQLRDPTFTMGKSFDTHCPLGPAIVTGDELGSPAGHALKTFVNGELRQDSDTKNLIFDCFDLIEFLSTAFTLEPGDVISTGTPGGVGVAMKPPVWLVEGDVMRVEIEGLGELENPVVAEPEDTAVF